jgi:hypothetical protein
VVAAAGKAQGANGPASAAPAGPKGETVAPPFPARYELVRALGFRVAPDLKSEFVFPHANYLGVGASVTFVDISGEPGKPGAFCKAKVSGKVGFIRCDGADFVRK